MYSVVSGKTMGYIKAYMVVRKDGVDNLFVSNQHTKMNPDSVNKTLKKLANKAGINKNIHNHSLRHLWATCMLDNNVPLERIQLCMGHSDISVTTRYTEISTQWRLFQHKEYYGSCSASKF